MKQQLKKGICFLSVILALEARFGFAQEPTLPQINLQTIVVSNIDITGKKDVAELESELVTRLMRLELEKLNTHIVMGKHDFEEACREKNINLTDCYSSKCLVNVGKLIGVNKVIGADIAISSDKIIYAVRLIDVKSEKIEKTRTMEFLYIPTQIQLMSSMILKNLFDIPVEAEITNKLLKKNEFASALNFPNADLLKLNGPRFGFTMLTGELANRVSAPKSLGGFEAHPVMFQFGYQFEKQYLNEGKVQALFEFIPMITGLDQGMFIPSFTILHGLRHNVQGWEFAFGPTVSLVPMAKGTYDIDNKWMLESAIKADTALVKNQTYNYVERLDYRGDLELQSAFVIGAGKTFKSGSLNIPVNVYVIPAKSGMRFGASFGFNSRNRTAKNYPGKI